MDLEETAADFQDWELLHVSTSPTAKSTATSQFEEIGSDSEEGMIQTNYFSLDNSSSRLMRTTVSEEDEVSSDNPSWIDPGSEELHGPAQYPRKISGEFWSDSSSDRSEERKFNDYKIKNEEVLAQEGKLFSGSGQPEGIEEIMKNGNGKEFEAYYAEDSMKFEGRNEINVAAKEVNEFVDEGNLGKHHADMGGTDDVKFGAVDDNGEIDRGQEVNLGDQKPENEVNRGDIIEAKNAGQKRVAVVWWKVPLELLRYCVLRVSPVWTFSVAAAVMGFVILGRRLYKMKKKTRGLELKVTMDDKKVSQFMSRAARLNEAFSVVKRVPVIRPSLPAVGVTPWPVMSLR